jgi:23S rRNA (uracil1939-C5)-methyltransferase
VTPEIRDPIGMADPWEYRSRSRFTARDGAWGFHDQGGRVFAVEECPISHPAVVDMLDVWRDKAARRSDFMQAEMRVEPTTDERLVLLIAEEGAENVEAPARALAAARPQVQGVVCWTARSSRRAGPSAHRLAGRRLLAGSQGHLIHALGEYRYQVSAESFFQVNPLQARRLLDCVRAGAGLAAGAAVVDGYCGVGTFLFPLAAQAGQAHGIEDDGFAFRDAQANWRQYGIDTCRLLRGKVEQLLPGLADKGLRAQTVVLDPPRRGCGRAALEGTVRVSPARIVMISCDPATLARDLRVLGEVGYETTVVQPIDMFPQTAQIECVALCQRAGE